MSCRADFRLQRFFHKLAAPARGENNTLAGAAGFSLAGAAGLFTDGSDGDNVESESHELVERS
jgi:hypothetical protein